MASPKISVNLFCFFFSSSVKELVHSNDKVWYKFKVSENCLLYKSDLKLPIK